MIELPLVFDRILKNRLRFDTIPIEDIKEEKVPIAKLLRHAAIKRGTKTYFYLLDRGKVSELTPLSDEGTFKTKKRLYTYRRHRDLDQLFVVAVKELF